VREGAAEAERVHRDRYHVAEAIYQAEVDPLPAADLVIDNSGIAAPRILSAGGRRSGVF
jgi:uridine kinase